MRGMRYAEVSQKELTFLDMTSLTVEEFEQLVPSFEGAFQERMQQWRLDGKRRSGRGYTTYANCPLPTPEDRLLFILVYLKTNMLQVLQLARRMQAVCMISASPTRCPIRCHPAVTCCRISDF